MECNSSGRMIKGNFCNQIALKKSPEEFAGLDFFLSFIFFLFLSSFHFVFFFAIVVFNNKIEPSDQRHKDEKVMNTGLRNKEIIWRWLALRLKKKKIPWQTKFVKYQFDENFKMINWSTFAFQAFLLCLWDAYFCEWWHLACVCLNLSERSWNTWVKELKSIPCGYR